MIPDEIQKIAMNMANQSAENEPAIVEIYLFPSTEEIRLIEVDPTAPNNIEKISPYYFPPDPQAGIPMPSGIALIPPEQKDTLPLPPGWGSWSDAQLIYKKEKEIA